MTDYAELVDRLRDGNGWAPYAADAIEALVKERDLQGKTATEKSEQFIAARKHAEALEIECEALQRKADAGEKLATELERICSWQEPLTLIAPELGGLLAAMYSAKDALAQWNAATQPETEKCV